MGCDEALAAGLINRIVPQAELGAAAGALARRLAAGPTHALGHLRRLVRGSFDRTLQEQLDAEARAFDDCARTADFREGVASFFDRRSASFQGE